ncbi:EamA domain - like 9 [Theobroma cacao]|nr:EamA domain - like 9 [Theobroma cacao]
MGSKKPFLVALLVHALSSGMILLSKAAFNMGMSTSVFVFYRQVAGTIFLVPFAMIFEGKNAKPLSLLTFCKIFMLALLGITLTLNLYGVALIYTSASLGAATINCIPVITFAFAVLLRQTAHLHDGLPCRMEKVTVKTVPGIAKVAGIMVCMAGVVTLAFYKGPVLQPLCHLHFQPHSGQDHHADGQGSSGKKWILGCFLLLVSCICWALWLVLQAQILKSYPSKITFTSIQCLSSAVQSFIVAIALERDPHQWKLGWNFRLLAVVYCGIFVTGIAYYLQAWVIATKGPVFHAVMTPSNLVMTILGSVFLLGETINLGSVLGAILLVISLYSVLWGKSKEQNMDNNLGCLPVQAQTDRSTQVKETPVLSSNPRPSLSM